MTDWDNDLSEDDQAEDAVIELTDIVDQGADTEEEEILDLTEIVGDDREDLDLDIEAEGDQEDSEPVASLNVEDLDVTEEQVMAALERVIEKKFADKIETLLFEVLERVIQNEVAEIKESLQQFVENEGAVSASDTLSDLLNKLHLS